MELRQQIQEFIDKRFEDISLRPRTFCLTKESLEDTWHSLLEFELLFAKNITPESFEDWRDLYSQIAKKHKCSNTFLACVAKDEEQLVEWLQEYRQLVYKNIK